jgi:hypothetical protein
MKNLFKLGCVLFIVCSILEIIGPQHSILQNETFQKK